MKRVLIAGGSGAIGSHLAKMLKAKGYSVAILSRFAKQSSDFEYFTWNIDTKTIDPNALVGADAIVHLAGANIGENRWTKSFKREVISSRADAVSILATELKRLNIQPKVFVSASAIGYYGSVTTDKIFTETDPPGTDFLGQVGTIWGNAVNEFKSLNIRTVILRTGVVLDKSSGALPKLLKPAKFGLASPIGSGKQFMPWIHIEDICRMYIFAIEEPEIQGVYNAVAPEFLTNSQFMKALAKVLNKKTFAPRVPVFMLRLMLGEGATIVLDGSRVSAEKIRKAGFNFQFSEIYSALNNLIKH